MKYHNKDFYAIEDYEDGKYIHIDGYIYTVGVGAPDNPDKTYRNIQYVGFCVPLSDFLSDDFDYDLVQEGLNQYVTDMTEEEANMAESNYFNGAAIKELPFSDLTLDTPAGFYVDYKQEYQMKASDFCEFFEFSISKHKRAEMDKSCFGGHFDWSDEDEPIVYAVRDDQGVFETRYINRVSQLVDCFDSMLPDYVDETLVENGFVYDEDAEANAEAAYYEQARDYISNSCSYLQGTDTFDVIFCLTHRDYIEDDVPFAKEEVAA